MTPNIDQTKAPEAKPASKPGAKDDLKSLPISEVEKKRMNSYAIYRITETLRVLLLLLAYRIFDPSAEPLSAKRPVGETLLKR